MIDRYTLPEMRELWNEAAKFDAVHAVTGETFGAIERQRTMECPPPESENNNPEKETDRVEG